MQFKLNMATDHKQSPGCQLALLSWVLNDHCFPIGVNPSQPISQASGGPEAINTPEGNPAKAQSHCKEPYYQPMAAGEAPSAGEPVSSCLTPAKSPKTSITTTTSATPHF